MFAKMTLEGRVLCTIGLYILGLITCCAIFFFGLRISGEIRDYRAKQDVFEYVLTNYDTLPKESGEVIIVTAGTIHVGVEYGYFYSAEGVPTYGEPKGNGYLQSPYYGDSYDSYYTEQILGNWIYYEYHDG